MTFADDTLDLPYVIAELGPSWVLSRDRGANEMTLARMIRAAEVAEASAIKLQLKSLAPGGYYDKKDRNAKPSWAGCPFATMGEYYEAREPDMRLLTGVAQYCGQLGLDWSASPWDVASVELLGRFDVPWVKVASASVTDLRLLHAVRALGRHVILSTGMSTLVDVERAYEALGATNITMLHCLSVYPATAAETDLRVMETLGRRFGCQVGWSGHERERDRAISTAAASRGAAVIERHLTLDVDHWGPDHSASLDPSAFHGMVRDVRTARRVSLMGSGAKVVAKSEESARARLRGV